MSAHSQVLLPVSTISTCSSSLPNCCCSLTAAASPTCCANLLLQCLHQNDQLAFKYVVSRVSQAGSPGGTQVPARFAGSSGPARSGILGSSCRWRRNRGASFPRGVDFLTGFPLQHGRHICSVSRALSILLCSPALRLSCKKRCLSLPACSMEEDHQPVWEPSRGERWLIKGIGRCADRIPIRL